MHPLLNIAVRAARGAGDVIVRHLDRLHTLTVQEKSRNDLVSEVDRQAEERVIGAIQHAYPDHSILAEESGRHAGNDYEWVIDPLDGTRNYLHGLPHFAVSIAVRFRGRTEHGVVFDPIRQEMFAASRGGGANVNGHRVRVGSQIRLSGALLASGLPFRRIAALEHQFRVEQTLMHEAAGIRRSGAAALDLAYVAAGRVDGFWEYGLGPWDIAAGELLVREAGGIVTDLRGADGAIGAGDVVAANPKVLRELLKVLVPAFRSLGADPIHPTAG